MGSVEALRTLANAPRSVRKMGLHIEPDYVVEKLWDEDDPYSKCRISLLLSANRFDLLHGASGSNPI